MNSAKQCGHGRLLQAVALTIILYVYFICYAYYSFLKNFIKAMFTEPCRGEAFGGPGMDAILLIMANALSPLNFRKGVRPVVLEKKRLIDYATCGG
ncbi:MAG: hypothetical protein EX330_05885 [Candidatus Brocadia sp. BROELEC01]|nr:hypothetical protein [Candidatus Brocadia sapporoensis]MEB2307745.1 hypothetical protein [Candidatus Brocadiaceae bacterium]RZV58289.1 MAG: hypothetical protein EX330_05885 [Candidatus Brocadia sp. BROELEC01]